MTGITRRGEARLFVIGIIGLVVVIHVAVAADATLQVVIPVDVALLTRSRGVLSSEWKTRQGMVELCVTPIRGVVAGLARRRNSSLLVIRIGCAVVILHVTRGAILAR